MTWNAHRIHIELRPSIDASKEKWPDRFSIRPFFFLSPTSNCAGTSWTKWQRRWVWVWSWAQSHSKSVFLHQSVFHAYTSISLIRPHGILGGNVRKITKAVSFEINESHFPLLMARSWRIPSGWDFQQNVFVNWTFVHPKRIHDIFFESQNAPPTKWFNSSIQMLGFHTQIDQQLLRIQRWKLLRQTVPAVDVTYLHEPHRRLIQ